MRLLLLLLLAGLGDDLAEFDPLNPPGSAPAMRQQCDEWFRAFGERLEPLLGADDAAATQALCDLYARATARSAEAEARRDRELAGYRDCIVGYRPTMRRITWKPGREQAGRQHDANAQALRRLAHRLDGVASACAAALRERRAPESREVLARALAKAKSAHLRAAAAAMVAEPAPLLAALKRERDDGVRAAIVAALGGREGSHAAVLAQLVGDRSERVRIAAAGALAEMHAVEGVEPLVFRLRKESGLALSAMTRALESLSGQRFGPFPDVWQKWWAAHGGKLLAEGLPPKGELPPPKADAHFYGIPQVSERVLYVFDISDSMRHRVGEQTRLERSRAELVRAIRALPRTASFGVILYNHGIQPWRDGVVRADPEAREDAVRFVELTLPHGTTNIYDALREAFRLAGAGAKKKQERIAVDTIYLLTDGSPTDENGFPEDALTVVRAVRKWNALGRVTIHTIGVGKDLNAPFLERLARENGGMFLHRE